MTDPDPLWINWLEQDQTRAMLEAAARRIYRQAERIALPRDLLPCHGWSGLAPSERDDCRRMLADDLWIYLREQGPRLVRTRSWAHWAEQDPDALLLRFTQHYLGHLKDQARTLDRDPGRALYRRLRQVLAVESSIQYRANRQGAFYSLEAAAMPMADLTMLRSEAYGSWPSPLAVVSAAELGRRDGLVRAAKFFWRAARGRIGGATFLPVRELALYLQAHYADLSPVRLAALDDPNRPEADAVAASAASGALMEPDLAFTRGRLPELARQLAAELNEMQAAALYWVQGARLTLDQAAHKLGYQSAAGVRYPFQGALVVIRDFCLQWPGLAPPDLDRDLFDEFIEALLEVCKNRPESRIREVKR